MTGAREWAEELQAGLDSLDQGVSVFDEELRLVAHNRRFVELVGLPERLVEHGARFVDLARHVAEREGIAPADLDDEVARRVHAARECVRSYGERTTASGRVVAAQTTPLRAGGFVTVYTDITERRLAEALTPARESELEARVNQRTLELRNLNAELLQNVRRLQQASAAHAKSEARLRLITDAIPAAIAYVDQGLIVRFANRRFAAMFRRDQDQVVGRDLHQILGARLLSELLVHIDSALAGQATVYEHTYVTAEGKSLITRNQLVPEIGGSGAVLGVFVLSIDVTEEKNAERAVSEAQRMSALGQLAGGLAHDFNNLLTVMVGNLSSIKDRLDESHAPLVGEYVEPAIRASHRGVEVVRRLLAFARQQPLDPNAVDVPRLLTETAQLLRRSLPANIAVRCVAEGEVWPALADAAALESAVVNLALNARDAMPAGGSLTLKASCEQVAAGGAGGSLPAGEYVRIDVADDGCGIPADAFAHVFEPFFTTKPFGSGSGLGLPMVLGFARQSSGDVRIQTEVGKGTCVSILLPRAAELSVLEAANPPPTSGVVVGGGRLALLVDDNEDVRQTVRRQLLDLGYQVLEARDADDARALLSTVADVAILVTDVIMPGKVGGLDLADEARKLVPGIQVVLMSGFTNWSAKGYDWFEEGLLLRKPFGREELTRAIRCANGSTTP
jgi:PAS domain S-box-containing protein